MLKSAGIMAAALVTLCYFIANERFPLREMPGLVSPAEARVGRPLTPMSVSGVARRTARRCAAGVYYC